MTTNARKTDAQRLGNGKKAFNVKQVEKMIEQGGGGTEYTAGDGISISAENAISVDTTTIQEKLTAGTGITIADNVISASGGADGYTLYKSYDWTELFETTLDGSQYKNLKAKKDVVIVFMGYIMGANDSNSSFITSFEFKKNVVYNMDSVRELLIPIIKNYSASSILYIGNLAISKDRNIATTTSTVDFYTMGVKMTGLTSTLTITKNYSVDAYTKVIEENPASLPNRAVMAYTKD